MFYGFAAGLLWAVDAVILDQVFQADIFTEMDALKSSIFTAGLHDTFSAMCVLIVFMLRSSRSGKKAGHHKRPESNRIQGLKFFILAALCGGPVGMSFYLASIHRIGPGLAASISAVYPAVGSLLAALFCKERLNGSQRMGLALCLAGAVWVSRTPEAITFQMPGLFFGFLAALCWGLEGVICSVGLKKHTYSYDEGLFIRQLTSSAVYLLVAFPIMGLLPELLPWTGGTPGNLSRSLLTSTVLPLIGMAGLAGAASYLCYYKAIERSGPGKAMAANVTYTAWAVLLEGIINRTLPELTTVFCVGLVFLGAVLVSGIYISGIEKQQSGTR